MKKRLISFLLAVVMVFSMVPSMAFADESTTENTSSVSNPFTDVTESDWYYDSVRYANANGIFSGTSATSFGPNAPMTRAMFVTVLGRMAGIDPADYAGESEFVDVAEDAYYAPYLKWAAKFNIASGTGNGKFSPDAEIDRAQMAVFFVRYFETFGVDYETGANVETVPEDIESVPEYAREAVLKLWKQGLLNGDGKNFMPKSRASRAQVATLCSNVDKSVDVWYSEPGVSSKNNRKDTTQNNQNKNDEPKKDDNKKPISGGSSSGGSSGGSSSGGTSTTKYYEVKFSLANGQKDITLPSTQSVAEGTSISTLTTPFKAGVIFLGWYYDADMTQAVEIGDKVSRNMTLYAKTAEGENVEGAATPGFAVLNNISAGNFEVSVTGASESNISFINISDVNAKVDFEIKGNTISATLAAGQTYKIELLDENATFAGYDKSVRYLSIFVPKTEVKNANLNANIKPVNVEDTEGLLKDVFDGIYKVDETNTVSENETSGTFIYYGGKGRSVGSTPEIGDVIAVTSGDVDLNDPTSTEGDVAYIKITGQSDGEVEGGTQYEYAMADVEDVLFIPDVLPIQNSWDQDTTDGNVLTISTQNLAEAMKNVEAESLDVGDFIGFIDGTYIGQDTASSYGKVEEFEISGENYIITYSAATEKNIEEALDVYYTQDREVTLTDKERKEIEEEIKKDVDESDYPSQAAAYIAAVMLESDDLTNVPDMNEVEARMSEIEPYMTRGRNSVQMRDGDKKVEVEFDKNNINVKLGVNSKLDHLEGKGFNVEIEIPFTVTIGDNIEISIKASFKEEVILKQKISTSRHKIGFLRYDYSLNASFEVGNYTGIGFTADMSTTDGGENESMLAKLEDIMDRLEDYHESGGISTTGGTMDGLAEIYSGVMENANDTWIDIVEVKLFESSGNAFFHIFCWQIKGSFVVSANLAVSLGMSFEYVTQKQYNFSVRIKSKQSTNETIDVITPQYNFDFYVVGTIGIRAGLRLEMYVGLFSLSIDKIGIVAEVGAYAQLWGYFFYHLHWEENEGKSENSAGAMFIEIGMYLDINFVAQLFSSSKLTWNPTIYANEWPLWSAGEQLNIYTAKYGTLPTPIKAGYVFDGWFADEGLTSEVTQDSKVGNYENHTLYAKWTAGEVEYTVKHYQEKLEATGNELDDKYDEVTADRQTLKGTTEAQTAAAAKEYTGFENSNVSQQEIKGDGSTVVKIYYERKEYNISWNGGEGNGVAVDPEKGQYTVGTHVKYGTPIVQPATPTKNSTDGHTYTFIGWLNELDPDAVPVMNVGEFVTREARYSARFSKDAKVFNVTYDSASLEGATNPNPDTYVYGTGLKLQKPTRTGYKFSCWCTNPEMTNPISEIPADSAKDYTLYARWDREWYDVTFDPKGATFADGEITTKNVGYDTKYGDLPSLSKENYTFGGWFTEEDGKGTKITPGTTVKIPGNHTLYAYWVEGTEFNIEYKNGGTLPDDAAVRYTVAEGLSSLPTPTKTGYDFDGWFGNSDLSGDKITAIPAGTTGKQTLYAKWTPKTYKVSFGYGDYEDITVKYGEPYGELPKATNTDSNYSFVGWGIGDNATAITADTLVSTAEDHTINALWNVTFDHIKIGGEPIVVKPNGRVVGYNKVAYDATKNQLILGYNYQGGETIQSDAEKVIELHKTTINGEEVYPSIWVQGDTTVINTRTSGDATGIYIETKEGVDTIKGGKTLTVEAGGTEKSKAIEVDENAGVVTFSGSGLTVVAKGAKGATESYGVYCGKSDCILYASSNSKITLQGGTQAFRGGYISKSYAAGYEKSKVSMSVNYDGSGSETDSSSKHSGKKYVAS